MGASTGRGERLEGPKCAESQSRQPGSIMLCPQAAWGAVVRLEGAERMGGPDPHLLFGPYQMGSRAFSQAVRLPLDAKCSHAAHTGVMGVVGDLEGVREIKMEGLVQASEAGKQASDLLLTCLDAAQTMYLLAKHTNCYQHIKCFR